MAKVIFKFGTQAQYNGLATKLENALYFLTDTGELYRGTVPFGKARVFQGIRFNNENDATSITRIVNSAPLASNDLMLIRNADNTTDLFMYVEDNWIKLNAGLSSSHITQLEETVFGTENTDGLVDLVEDLQDEITRLKAIQNSALHFVTTVQDHTQVQNPENGGIYQEGTKEFAWNGTEWVELGDIVDLSAITARINLQDDKIADLETLIGNPAHDETDDQTGETTHVPASGLYAEIFNHQPTIPTFNGSVPGLVPVLSGNYTTAQKQQMFMNALGGWVNVSGGSGGQTQYVAPDGVTVFYTVEDYVEYMVEHYGNIWEDMT